MTTLKDLRSEFDSVLLGDLIYARVRLLVRRLLARRDPRVYARGAANLDDGLGDVLNDFVLDVLIKEGDPQIVYVMTTASTLADFDRLILHHARRYLARTRTRTVTDNLIDRSRRVLIADPFELVSGSGSSEAYGLRGRSYDGRSASTERELRQAATLARAVPKLATDATERAPKVYDADGLSAVLRILVDSVSSPVRRSDLQGFFDDLLTAWTPSVLGLPEDQQVTGATESAEERALVRDSARRLVESMNDEERIIFLSKYAGIADRDVAERLGMSRQSVDPRKRALFVRIQEELSDVDDHLQAAVVKQTMIDLASLGLEAS